MAGSIFDNVGTVKQPKPPLPQPPGVKTTPGMGGPSGGSSVSPNQPRTIVNQPGVNAAPVGAPSTTPSPSIFTSGVTAGPATRAGKRQYGVGGSAAPPSIWDPPPITGATDASGNPAGVGAPAAVGAPAPATGPTQPPLPQPPGGGYHMPGRGGPEELPAVTAQPGTREYRQQFAAREAVKDKNRAMGFSLQDMGLENVHERGQAAYSREAFFDEFGPGASPIYTYDLANGKRLLSGSSYWDPKNWTGENGQKDAGERERQMNAAWEDIPPQELKQIQDWQQFKNSPEAQGWAQNAQGSVYAGWQMKQQFDKAVQNGHLRRQPDGTYLGYALNPGVDPRYPQGVVNRHTDQYGRDLGVTQPAGGAAPAPAPAPAAPAPAVPPVASAAPAAPAAPVPAAIATAPGSLSSGWLSGGTDGGNGGMPQPPAAPAQTTDPTTALTPTSQPGTQPGMRPQTPGDLQPGSGSSAAPTIQLSRLPSSEELAAYPPHAIVDTPYGVLEPSPDGGPRTLKMNEQGRAHYRQVKARRLRAFGERLFSNDPNAPLPPVEVGQPAYNPFTGKWVE